MSKATIIEQSDFQKLQQLNIFKTANVELENTFSNLTVLSMGLGQDSTAILFKIVFDAEFRARYAPEKLLVLFSDTGNEHPFTYQYRDEVVIPFCQEHGIEFTTISSDMGYHAPSWKSLVHQWEIPPRANIGSVAFHKSCTHQLKLNPQYNYVEKWLMENYAIPKSARKQAYVYFAKYFGKIRWLVGIAKGEEKRVQDAEKETIAWKKQSVVVEYPLLGVGMDRSACQAYIKSLGFQLPMPSNCMFCPYGSNHLELLWLYHSYPERFYEWVQLEQNKLDAWADTDVKNLGVVGKLHKDGERKGQAVTLLDVLEEAKAKYPNVTLEQLQEYKWSHGHCVASKY